MTQSGVRAFVFDMDGTIVDNMPYHTQAWLQFFAETGIEMSATRLDELMGANTTPVLLRQVLGGPVSDAQLLAYSELKEAIYRALYGPHLKPVRGLVPFLAEVQRLGIALALATSAGRRNIEFILGGLGLGSTFDVVVSGDDVPQGKAGAEIYFATARELGVPPPSCLVFEDSMQGIEAAGQAGMRVVLLATSPDAAQLCDLQPVVRTLQDFVIEPVELLQI